MKNERKLVVVTWLDAWQYSGYYNKYNNYSGIMCQNVGFLLEENEETIVLCSNVTDEDDERNVMVIPWDYVTKYEELVG